MSTPRVRDLSLHTYEYPRPALTADLIALRWREGQLQVLLIKRSHDPFSGHWALPGGFVDSGERPISAAARELREETGVSVEEELAVKWYEMHEIGLPGAALASFFGPLNLVRDAVLK